jgi:hypothetical protein
MQDLYTGCVCICVKSKMASCQPTLHWSQPLAAGDALQPQKPGAPPVVSLHGWRGGLRSSGLCGCTHTLVVVLVPQ